MTILLCLWSYATERGASIVVTFPPITTLASLVAQVVKNVTAMQETWVRPLGWEDPLEEGMATHSSILAQRIPRTEGLVGWSPWGCKESDMTE